MMILKVFMKGKRREIMGNIITSIGMGTQHTMSMMVCSGTIGLFSLPTTNIST
jgi:hypothetical protein